MRPNVPIAMYVDPRRGLATEVLYVDFVNDEFCILPDENLEGGEQETIKGVNNITWLAPAHPLTSEDQDKILVRALSTWGAESQFLMAVEEMAELTQALMKFHFRHKTRRTEQSLADLLQEIADVKIMVRQLELVLGPDRVQLQVDYKMKRLEGRLNGTQ